MEALVGHRLVAQVQTGQGIEFLVGIVHIFHLVHKPGIALCIGILNGCLSPRIDEVLGVEHVQHRPDAVAVHLGQVAVVGRNDLADSRQLRRDVGIDQFLIAAQLGSMIAAHTLMVVTGLVLVEHIAGQVQHTVVERRVVQYLTVHLGHLTNLPAFRLLDKLVLVVGVQVAAVHLPQVDQTEQQQGGNGQPRL